MSAEAAEKDETTSEISQNSKDKFIAKSIYIELVATVMRLAIGDGRQVMKYVDAITKLNADKFTVTMEHDPSFEMTFNVADMRAVEMAHWQWILKNVPDYRQEDTDVWVEGDTLCLIETMVGTFPDGKVNRSVVKMRFWFDDDGKINRQHVNYNAEEVAPTQQLIATMPAGWTGDS